MENKVLNYKEIIEYIRSTGMSIDDFISGDFNLSELGEIKEVDISKPADHYKAKIYHFIYHNVYVSVMYAFPDCRIEKWSNVYQYLPPFPK